MDSIDRIFISIYLFIAMLLVTGMGIMFMYGPASIGIVFGFLAAYCVRLAYLITIRRF